MFTQACSFVAMRRCFGAVLAVGTVLTPVSVLAAPAAAQFQLNIPAGPLERALDILASSTGVQLLYKPAAVHGRTVRRLEGRYTVDDALRRLLSGTGMKVSRTAPGAYVLVAAPAAQAKQERPSVPPAPGVPRRQRERRVENRPQAEPAAGPEIVVTGTNLRRSEGAATEVITVSRAEIERSGFGSVSEAIASLPQNFGGTGTEDTSLTSADPSGSNNSLGSSANLRGLGSDATLTLINGRRVAGSGGKGDFADLSLIPLGAVDRIEVLPDGASAIYGSDAVGGVINVILRRRFDGFESRLRLGAATQGGAEDIQVGHLAGTTWKGGHVLAAYEYGRRGRLGSDERAFTRSADLRPFGGSDWRLYFSNPGTLLGFDPQTGAIVPTNSIPRGQDGRNLTTADLLPGPNLQNQLEGSDILPRQERHSAYLTAEQEVLGGVRLFAEGRFAHRKYDFNGPGSPGVFLVTAANPFFVAPDGGTFTIVGYSFFDELGSTRNVGRVSAWSGNGGLQIDGPGDWQIDAFGTYAKERSRTRADNFVNPSFVDEALGNVADDPMTPFSTAQSGFLNLFGDGRVNSPEVLGFIGQGFSEELFRSTIKSANVKADGSVVDLPGGPVQAAFGGGLRREAFLREGEALFFGSSPITLSRTDANRDIKAVFAEVLIPIFGKANAIVGARRLEVTGAVRHEDYSDFGSATNPKVAMTWEPVMGLALSASYGTSFRAPALRELRDRVAVSPTQLPDGRGGQTPVLFLTGGNPDLEPETARSFSAAARFAPKALSRTSFQATYFQTRFRGRIEQPALEDSSRALTNPAYAPFIRTVSPATNPADRALLVELINMPGSEVPDFFPPEFFQAVVDGRYVNSAEVKVSGVDFLASHGFRLLGGEAAAAANASLLLDYKRRVTPVAELVERVGTIGNPSRFRARGTLNWSKGLWGLSTGANYVAGYTDDVSSPARHVDAWATFDFQLRYEAGETGPLAGTTVALSAQNIFDNDPPFANRRSGHGYDATNADPIGRFLSVQLTKRW
jgi:outer membrane receptor protein involved in Fe transport